MVTLVGCRHYRYLWVEGVRVGARFTAYSSSVKPFLIFSKRHDAKRGFFPRREGKGKQKRDGLKKGARRREEFQRDPRSKFFSGRQSEATKCVEEDVKSEERCCAVVALFKIEIRKIRAFPVFVRQTGTMKVPSFSLACFNDFLIPCFLSFSLSLWQSLLFSVSGTFGRRTEFLRFPWSWKRGPFSASTQTGQTRVAPRQGPPNRFNRRGGGNRESGLEARIGLGRDRRDWRYWRD